MKQDQNLKNKIVMISGAAGQLGTEYARGFAEAGSVIIAADLDFEKAVGLVGSLPGGMEKHLALELDVSDPVSVSGGFEQIRKKFGTLDVLINNAGIGVFEPWEKRNFEDFMKVFQVNAGGTFLCTKEAVKLMREKKTAGSIINIGSIYGVVSSDPEIYGDTLRMNSECYSGSKAAVIQMTKYFAVHLAPYGIRVNCISPGGIEDKSKQKNDFIKNYASRTPMERLGREEELAGMAKFLASDSASYITGQNIIIDGGFTSW